MTTIELLFIQEEVAKWAEEVEDTFRIQIQALNIGVTGDLLRSLSWKALQTSSGGVVQFSFLEYGRMVDMGVGRGVTIETMASNRKKWEKASGKQDDKGRKPEKWYSKTAYGMISRLQYRLSYNLTQDVIDRLITQIQKAEN